MARCLAGYFGPLLADLFGHGPFSPLPQSFRTKIRTTSAILPRRRQVSAAKLSRLRNGCFAPHHRLAKTQISGAILPRAAACVGRVVSRAISDLCLRIFSVMDLSVHFLKASAQKSELHPRSFRARRQAFYFISPISLISLISLIFIKPPDAPPAASERSETEPPEKRVLCKKKALSER